MKFSGVGQGVAGCCLMAAMMSFVLGCEHNEVHTSPADVDGLWTVVGIWTGKAEVAFNQTEKEVSALMAKGNTFWTFTGVMTDDNLAGTFVASSGDQPITIDAKVSINDMRGWWIHSPESGAFTATRK